MAGTPALPPLFFSYVAFNEAATATDDDNDVTAEFGTADSAIPNRTLDLPFSGFTPADPDADPAIVASRSRNQCNLIGENDMYAYQATGGTSPIHSIKVSQDSGDDIMTIDQDMGGPGGKGNGFKLETEMGVDTLSGYANLKAGDYTWELHASDEMAYPTEVTVKWDFRVVAVDYAAPASPVGASESTANPPVDTWASYISSKFSPTPVAEGATQSQIQVESEFVGGFVEGGALVVPGLDLATDGMISGFMNEAATDGPADVDVFWIGGLTPDSELKVTIAGEEESGIGSYNLVEVALYEHLQDEEQMPDARTVIGSATSEMADGFTVENVACGFYYLEVSGAEGEYTLSWDFTE
jgi:hypothetical protein